MKAVGIVLAAGASQRMGSPKALLRGRDGVSLAVRQAALLRAGGFDPVAVVLGAGVEDIRKQLPGDLPTVENPRWAQGRATSLQAGLGAFPEADGWLFLPVDAVGVKPETIQIIRATVEEAPLVLWRPMYRGEKGNLLWIPRATGARLMQVPADARVDEWVRPQARALEVDDPAILRNVNTPGEWAEFICPEPGPS